MLVLATIADAVRDTASAIGGVAVIAGAVVGIVRFARRIDRTLDDMRNHVIPHFRPATVDEIRSGARAEGDTIPERVAQLEGDLSTQTVALSDHLATEPIESGQIRARLGGIERTLNMKETPNS